MPKNKGFIQFIIILVLLVVILSLMRVSLSSLFSNPILKDNFGFLWQWISYLWNNYFAATFNYFWGIWVNIFWQPFLDTMKGFTQGVSPFQNTLK